MLRILAFLAVTTFAAHAAAEVLRMPGKPVAPQPKVAMTALRGDAGTPQAAVVLPPLSRAKVEDASAGIEKALQVASPRDPASEAAGARVVALQWARSTDAQGWVAGLMVTSSGAAAVRAALALRGLPPGAELRAAAPDGRVLGPVSIEQIGAAQRVHGMFWTPLTAGETQRLELFAPGAAPPLEAEARVLSVSHFHAAPDERFKAGGVGASQPCEEDVVCTAASNPALARAARSVAKLVYTKAGASYLCTGTLVNDGGASEVPYLYTAAHCVDSQAVAATLNTFWFFEAPQCGAKSSAPYHQLSGGATLLYVDPESDVALLRLEDRAPQGAWFAGWDATPLDSGTGIAALHHPMGDVKKLALGAVAAPVDPRYVTASWRSGTTEPGSSGSGIFTQAGGEFLLRGGLRGGSASCQSSGRLDDPSNRDYYSRLDRAMPSLAKWLGGRPQPIEDFGGLWYDADEPGWGVSITQSSAGEAFVTWYTYDDAGRAAWYAAPEVSWRSAASLEATLYRGTGSPFAAAYDRSRFALTPVGTLRIDFGRGTATFSASVDGRAINKPLTRLPL